MLYLRVVGRFPVSLLLSNIELEIDKWSRMTSNVSSSFTKRKFSSGEEMRPGNNRKDFRERHVRGSVDTLAQTNFHCTQLFVSRKIILSTRGNYLFKMFTTETNVFFFFISKLFTTALTSNTLCHSISLRLQSV